MSSSQGIEAPLVAAMNAVHMEGIDQPDMEIKPLSLEQAQRSLEESKKELGQLLGIIGAIMNRLQGQELTADDKDKLQAQCDKAEEDRAVVQARVNRWLSIVDGLALSAPSVKDTSLEERNQEKLVFQNGGKSVQLNLDAEYTRYFHESVIKEKMAKFSETDRKYYPKVTSDVLVFVHHAREIACAKLGNAAEGIATRVLTILCLDTRINGIFQTQIQTEPAGAKWTWEKSISVFITCALTTVEKGAAVERFARKGRGKGESYAELGHRLERMATIYKIDELPQCADVTETLKMSVPSLALAVLEVRQAVQFIIGQTNLTCPDFKSLPFLIEGLKTLAGPDDTPLYQAAFEQRKRVRGSLDEEDDGQGQQSKPKRARFHEKGNNAVKNDLDNPNEIAIQGQREQSGRSRNADFKHQNHEGEERYEEQYNGAINDQNFILNNVAPFIPHQVIMEDSAETTEVAKTMATVEVIEEVTVDRNSSVFLSPRVDDLAVIKKVHTVTASLNKSTFDPVAPSNHENGSDGQLKDDGRKRKQRNRKSRTFSATLPSGEGESSEERNEDEEEVLSKTKENEMEKPSSSLEMNGEKSCMNEKGNRSESHPVPASAHESSFEKNLSESLSTKSQRKRAKKRDKKSVVSGEKEDIGDGLVPDVIDDMDSVQHQTITVVGSLKIISELQSQQPDVLPVMLSSLEEDDESGRRPEMSENGRTDQAKIRFNGIELDEQKFEETFDTAAVAANIGRAQYMPPGCTVYEASNYGFTDERMQPSIFDDPNNLFRNGFPITVYEESGEEKVQTPQACASKKGLLDNRYHPKVKLFGDEYLALLDTGATHSFLSPEIVKKYSIPLNVKTGKIQLANKSMVERIGETELVELVCGKVQISAPFEVLEQEHPVVIGMDLFARLGFQLVGLPDPELSTDPIPAPVEDEKPTLKPLTIPEVEKTEKFIKEKEKFMCAIKGELSENEKIPASSHCPVPEMKVYLKVPEGVELFRRSRTFAHAQKPILDDAVATWLKDDVITLAPPGNAFNNTLTLAAKKDAEGKKTLFRVCLDPRPLNALLPDDNFPVPLIADIMNFAGGNAIYSTIDLRQAYHRLPIHKEDQKLTAFMHNGIQYMFKKAPFGLKPLSSLFQRGMSRILGDLPFVRNFIDDILIASKNREEHAEHVKIVIERLTKANLIINKDKCNFFSTQVALLGFIIDVNGKRIDPNKLANINEWLPPTTGKQVMSYMGTFNFFRDYVPLISTISAPLDALRNTPGTFKLNKLQLRCFNTLKNLLVSAPILHYADFSLPFYVATDASNFGIGVVLYQLPDGEKNPKNIRYIAFVARSLQPSERNYSATQRELLAIVFALKKLHYYLWGRHFTLFTDHRALTFMHTQKEMNSMLTAWQETILDYNFKVEYRPGALNILPDALSRQFPQELWTLKIAGMAPKKVYGYVHLIQDKETPRATVPEKERQAVLAEVHSLGHFGANAMVKSIHVKSKTWPLLAKDCLEYVQRCHQCQRVNIARKGYHPLATIYAHLPGEHMAVDLAGPFPVKGDEKYRFLLVLVDVCTRFVILRPIPNKETLTVMTTLYDIFTTIGFPRILQSDNGKEFVSKIMTEMTKTFQVQHRLVTPYHPRSNGVAENHVKTACNIIRKECQDRKEKWAQHVPRAQLAMNTKVAALHNSSPYSLFFARKANGESNYPADKDGNASHEELLKRFEYMNEVVFPAIETRVKTYQRRKADEFNRTVLLNDFATGALVMSLDPIRGDKLSARYEGPYTVVRKTTGGSYVLKDGTGEELGRKFAPSQLKLVLDDFEETPIYEVETILDHRERPGEGVEYLVKWKGYEKIKDRTWEPPASFIERKCITDYWRSRDLQEVQSLSQPSTDSRPAATKRKATVDQQESTSDERDDNTVALNSITNEEQIKTPTRKSGRQRKKSRQA